MSEPLPADLSRLGDELARATERRLAARRRRAHLARRMASTGAAAAIAFVALFPGVLGGADRAGDVLRLASTHTATAYVPVACDQPRGATFSAPRPCGQPGATDTAPESLARRYAAR